MIQQEPDVKFSGYDMKNIAPKKKYGNFRTDLKRGREQEQMVADVFNGSKFEVKSDYMAHRTGNIAIELMSRGKDSGINTTEACHWVYKIVSADLILVITTEKLKSFISDNMDKYKVVMGGDNNTSKMILIPIKDLILIK